MNLIERAIKYPVGVTVGVSFILLFGLLSLFNIPVQLTPDVDRANITVTTNWFGASTEEIEREIIDKQEDKLKSIEGLKRMTSESQDGTGSIVLEFPIGTDINAAMLKVANKLEQVDDYPELADQPTITNVDARSNAIAWIVLKSLPGNDRPIAQYRHLCEEIIQPRLERTSGVAASNLFGGTDLEIHVTIDPHALAARGLTIDRVSQILKQENKNVSAGDFDEGKRRYIVRTLGEFKNLNDIKNIVLRRQGADTLYLKDIAQVSLDYQKEDFSVRQFGENAIAINCQRSNGANVLETMKGLKSAIEELNQGILKDKQLKLHQVYDETTYIYSSLNLVEINIIFGSLLAIGILFLYLKSRSSVLVIATAIPISAIGTFVALAAMGRNINVISLAGMSFAVGMVVDNAIVILENIYRHLQLGKSRLQAALEATREVWGAVLASTLTTMAVFLPIIFIEEEAGQLFRDIAIAISCSVALSLLVSITVIPCLSSRILKTKNNQNTIHLDHWGQSIVTRVSNLVHNILLSKSKTYQVIIVLTLLSFGGTYLLFPSMEYLPKGNRNLLFGVILPPPGYNLKELSQIGKNLEQNIYSHFSPEKVTDNSSPQEPFIDNFFFVARGRQAFMGAVASDPSQIGSLQGILNAPLWQTPGTMAFINQASLFGREIGQGRSIEVELTGPELPKLLNLSFQFFMKLMTMFPQEQGGQVRPKPSLDLGNPEVHVVTDRLKAASMNLDTQSIGVAIDVMLDGRKTSTYKYQGQEIDLILKGEDQFDLNSQDIEQLPLVSQSGKIIHLGSVADIHMRNGPEQINHVERRRTITLSVVPPESVALEDAMEQINQELIMPAKQSGQLNQLYQVHLAGTADDLVQTRDALKWNFLLAILITFLLMSALFENFLYPLVIMFSVPLASVGGFIGLALVNLFTYQPLDVLTMLGFVILIGTVVNNAILIVHQALSLIREQQMAVPEALKESVRIRIRPIFMSTTTSVFGMLPLVLMPGSGSELYRGIGSVVVGGLITSTIFTLILIPAIFNVTWNVWNYLKKNTVSQVVT